MQGKLDADAWYTANDLYRIFSIETTQTLGAFESGQLQGTEADGKYKSESVLFLGADVHGWLKAGAPDASRGRRARSAPKSGSPAATPKSDPRPGYMAPSGATERPKCRKCGSTNVLVYQYWKDSDFQFHDDCQYCGALLPTRDSRASGRSGPSEASPKTKGDKMNDTARLTGAEEGSLLAELRTEYPAARAADIEALVVAGVTAGNAEAALRQRWSREWACSASTRAEFHGDREAFLAFRLAEAKGTARVANRRAITR
jgi:hypothetical protein